MAGGDLNQIGPSTWEEAKCSDDHIMICRLHSLFVDQTLYTCFAVGLFFYCIFMYLFLQRENAHITNNPEVQWHLKEIKEEEKEFEEEVKVRYLQEQRKRRIKRRAYMNEYKQEKLTSMDPKEREEKLEKEQKRKEQQILHEQMLYHQVLQHQQRQMTPQEDKYLRQLIRKDVKEIARIQKYQDDDGTESDEEQRLEDKVQYGSDSESDVPSQSPYLEYMDDDEEMYGPEDLEGDEGTEAIEMGDDELQFDQEDESDVEYDDEESKEGDTMEKLVDTSDSARSQDVLTESIDSSHQQESQEESKVAGSSMEMVDLSKKKATKVFDQGEMKEFKPSGSVNQSQKKRDKRKAKKQEEMKIESEKQAKILAKEVSRQKEMYFQQLEKSKGQDVIKTASGKILKKKVLPKKTQVDDKGNEWEVVDQKKTVVVEESASEDGNSSSDSD